LGAQLEQLLPGGGIVLAERAVDVVDVALLPHSGAHLGVAEHERVEGAGIRKCVRKGGKAAEGKRDHRSPLGADVEPDALERGGVALQRVVRRRVGRPVPG
jgi:hypothetical protein